MGEMADEGGFEGQMSLLESVLGRRTIHILKIEPFWDAKGQNPCSERFRICFIESSRKIDNFDDLENVV